MRWYRTGSVIAVLWGWMSCSVVWADVIEGKIVSLNTSGVNLAVYDPQGQAYPNLLQLRVGEPKLLQGLRAYDWVRADVRQAKSGAWDAVSIKKIATPKASASGAPFSAAPQMPGNLSKNLSQALQSPQAQSAVRGGLLGAVTGALSAGASGGKAGKGALVGAGVGAATGLLQYLFNAPAPQAQPAGGAYVIQERPQHPSGRRIIRHYDKDGHLISEEEMR